MPQPHQMPEPHSNRSFPSGSLPSDERQLRARVISIADNNRLTATQKFSAYAELMSALEARGQQIPPSVLATLAHRSAKTLKFAPYHEKNQLLRYYTDTSKKTFLTAVATALCNHVERCNSQGLANTAWALSLADPTRLHTIVSPNDLETLTDPREWLQVYHALLVANLVSPTTLFDTLQTIHDSYQRSPLNSFEKAVVKWLTESFGDSLGTLESQVVIAGIATDFLITCGDRKLIIECDGDQYHLSGGRDGGTRLGRDIIQDRVLARFGYSVLHILYSEFQSPRARLALAQKITRLLEN